MQTRAHATEIGNFRAGGGIKVWKKGWEDTTILARFISSPAHLHPTDIMLKVAALALLAGSADAFVASPTRATRPLAPRSAASSADVTMAAAGDFVPDMQRRNVMNLVLLGGAAIPVAWLGGGFIYFLVPPKPAGGGGGGLTAKDALGNDVAVVDWVKLHPFPDRALVQGLKGDAHYLISTESGKLEEYAVNAVCTHLGCVVPWNRAANKFICPCHGSQYDNTGKVVRGPAPLSLALAHCNDVDGKAVLSPWTETDFRTDSPPWWK